jgi:putative transposase
LSQQCRLAGVSRATVYAQRQPKVIDEVELLLCRLIDEDTPGGHSLAAARW